MNLLRKEILKDDAMRDGKVKCCCSHTFVIRPDREYGICNYCYRKVKNNSLAHFRYKLLRVQKQIDELLEKTYD